MPHLGQPPPRLRPLLTFTAAPHLCKVALRLTTFPICANPCCTAEAQRREARTLLLNRSKILLAPASSAYKHSIK